VFVCASIESFPELPPQEVLSCLVDLQFTSVELPLHEQGMSWLKPSNVMSNLEEAVNRCRATERLTIVTFSFDTSAQGDLYYEEFAACCRLAKAMRVVPLVVPAAELGTPFNAEIERLQQLVEIASLEGCLVALKTQIGCMTEDPDTAVVLCDNVQGLGLALDPSHYVTGPRQGRDYAKVMSYVYHLHLRDSTKSNLHVRVGQGEVDYSRLISQLAAANYSRALSVQMAPIEGIEHRAEVRKMRLLLESLI